MTTKKTLDDVEAKHGFKFGGGHPTKRKAIATVSCHTPGCTSTPTEIHTDTVLPVYCGACSTLLYDHDKKKPTAKKSSLDLIPESQLEEIIRRVAQELGQA